MKIPFWVQPAMWKHYSLSCIFWQFLISFSLWQRSVYDQKPYSCSVLKRVLYPSKHSQQYTDSIVVLFTFRMRKQKLQNMHLRSKLLAAGIKINTTSYQAIILWWNYNQTIQIRHNTQHNALVFLIWLFEVNNKVFPEVCHYMFDKSWHIRNNCL